jgi:serine/threonine protein kinase
LERFIQEARTLALFNHPNIVRVRRFFRAHNTAYIVMDYEEGRCLADVLKEGETAEESELMHLLPPLLAGLDTVHQAGYLHRDIKPGNIYLRFRDNSPVLIDFGAARYDVGSRSRSVTSLVTPGYAPFEQYRSQGNQGPWTDIYALGAVLYRTIGGKKPVDATERIEAIVEKKADPLKPAVEVGRDRYSKRLLEAIDWALQARESKRPQNVSELEKAILLDVHQDPFSPLKWAGAFVFVAFVVVVAVILMGRGDKTTFHDTNTPPASVEIAPHDEPPAVIETWTYGKIFRDRLQDGSLGPQMVVIPAGRFQMGDIQGVGQSDEKPVHWVSVDSFAMGRYEVTFAEYDRFAEATARNKPDDEGWGRGNLPVIDVSWNDATAYADWLSQQTGFSTKVLVVGIAKTFVEKTIPLAY